MQSLKKQEKQKVRKEEIVTINESDNNNAVKELTS